MQRLVNKTGDVRRLPVATLSLLLLVTACGGSNTRPSPVVTPSPTPTPSDGVVPGPASGPTRIAFVGADPAPGADVGRCGPSIEGCRDRVRIRLELQAPSGGPVLYVRLFLHSDTLQACLIGQTGPFALPAGAPERIEIVLDEADACRTPVHIRTMAAVVEGPVQVASRQQWGIRYTFLP